MADATAAGSATEPAKPSTTQSSETPRVFAPLGEQVDQINIDKPDAEGVAIEEVESLCIQCHQNGVTRILLTRIPYFREVVLMSFSCDHCGYRNNEIRPAGSIQEKGLKITLRLTKPADLQRQIVRSETAVCRVEELDLELPPGRGRLTNIEGLLTDVRDDLNQGQDRRRAANPDLHTKLQNIIHRLDAMIAGKAFPFTFTVDDPAGNSSLEPFADDASGIYLRREYPRTHQQNVQLGLAEDGPPGTNGETSNGASTADLDDTEILEGETYSIPTECPGCTQPATVNMQMVNIPFFKQVVLTAVVCEHCGYKTSEVKTGGGVPDKGQRIWLDVRTREDLSRDILKSETCALKVPECHVEVQSGTMGGRFTTVEGLLTQIRDDLRGNIFDVGGDATRQGGDSMPAGQRDAWTVFFETLDRALDGEMPFSLQLEDPLGSSYVQSLTAPEPDPQIRTELYTRTVEEEDELGLIDMRTHRNADGEYVKESETQKESAP